MKLRKFPLLSLFLATAAVPVALTACGSDEGDGTTRGADGTDGTDGEDGVNGSNGENGTDGDAGTDGAVGQNGADGDDGTNGTNGTNGTDGVDGVDGEDSEETPIILESNLIDWVKTRVEAIKDDTEDEGEFLPLARGSTDTVRTARGMTHNVVVRWFDTLTFTNSTVRYGANGDFTAYFGDGGTRELYSGSGTSGWFWSNHEYVSGAVPKVTATSAAPTGQAAALASWLAAAGTLGVADIADVSSGSDWNANNGALSKYLDNHKKQIGGSYFKIVQDPTTGAWGVDRSAAAKRYDATGSTQVRIRGTGLLSSGGATDVVVSGTQGNCSGTHTPWGTVLSGEENVQDYYGDLEVFFGGSGAFTANPAGVADASPGGDIVLDYAPTTSSTYGRHPDAAQNYPRDHYGYMTEIDVGASAGSAYDAATGNGHQKLGAMGRARWENATVVTGENWKLEDGKPIVIYGGDDRRGGRIFKFVTSANWTASMTKAQTRNLLASGKLYVAHFADLKNDGNGLTIGAAGVTPTAAAPGNGKWIELSLTNVTDDAPNAPALGAGTKVGAALANNAWNGMGAFTSDDQVHSILYTASNKLGVMELNRPEDLEYNPFDQTVYIAFTNHGAGIALKNDGTLQGVNGPTRVDPAGAVFSMKEANAANPGTSATFTFWASWLGTSGAAADHEYAASCPDNVVIDPDGGVWFGTDGNPGVNGYADAVYYLDLEESRAYRVAATPSDAEATGPTFSADGNSLFFNVQHPGESRYSNWPGDSDFGPLSSLVAVYPRR